MSSVTVADVLRMSAATLSKRLLTQQAAGSSSLAVIDVRDDDYVGGHIKGSKHMPSTTLDKKLPALVRELQDKETVVFHCALSQQRGPSAALRYLRMRQEFLGAAKDSQPDGRQDVYVLDRGFTGWQEEYGEDERLTEGFVKELWRAS